MTPKIAPLPPIEYVPYDVCETGKRMTKIFGSDVTYPDKAVFNHRYFGPSFGDGGLECWDVEVADFGLNGFRPAIENQSSL